MLTQFIADNIITELIKQQKVQDFTASGKSAASLRSLVTTTRIMIFGDAYFQNQIYGTRPWQNRPKRVPLAYVRRIEAWIRAKSLTINPYAVAWVLIKSGDRVHRGQREGLKVLQVATDVLNANRATYEKILLVEAKQKITAAWQSAS